MTILRGRQEYLSLICDPLVGLDTSYSATPNLIQSWEINDDATEYTLHLQEGVVFSDGTPFNAEVCKYNLETMGSLYYCAYVYTLESIDVVDDYTLTVKFNATTVTFLQQLFNICVLPLNSVDADGNITSFIGTGPFILDDYEENIEATLIRNDNYWNAEKLPQIKTIKWLVIDTAEARVMALESGQVDVIGYAEHSREISFSSIASFEESGEFTLIKENADAYNCVYSIGMNWKRGFLQDQALRSALEYAIDREELASAIYFGTMSPCPYMMNPNFRDCSNAVEPFTYDPEKAVGILQDAGYVLENGVLSKDGEPVSLEYVTTTSTEDKDLAVFVQAYLKDIGISVSIKSIDAAQCTELMKSGDYDLAKGALWFEPTVSALSFYGIGDDYNPMGPYGGLGFGVNEDVLGYAQEILAAKNYNELGEACGKFWAANTAACPTIPIVASFRIAVCNDRFTGFEFNPNYMFVDLSKVTVK